MARRSSTGGSFGRFFAIAGIAAVAVGTGYWFTHKPVPPQEKPIISRPAAFPAKPEGRQKIKIYVMKFDKDDVSLAPVVRSVPTDADPHETALQDLIATNREVGDSQNLIPHGTKLLGLKIKRGIAYADFSKELVDNFNAGSTGEEMLVNAIIGTLTQFDDVKKVQILVEGKKIDSIGEHLDVSEPLTADSSVFSKGDTGD